MSQFDDPIRSIARAAKLRDWDMIDAALEDLRLCGRMSVIRGFQDARDERLPSLSSPDPVMISDLTDREGVEIDERYGAPKWKRKAA